MTVPRGDRKREREASSSNESCSRQRNDEVRDNLASNFSSSLQQQPSSPTALLSSSDIMSRLLRVLTASTDSPSTSVQNEATTAAASTPNQHSYEDLHQALLRAAHLQDSLLAPNFGQMIERSMRIPNQPLPLQQQVNTNPTLQQLILLTQLAGLTNTNQQQTGAQIGGGQRVSGIPSALTALLGCLNQNNVQEALRNNVAAFDNAVQIVASQPSPGPGSIITFGSLANPAPSQQQAFLSQDMITQQQLLHQLRNIVGQQSSMQSGFPSSSINARLPQQQQPGLDIILQALMANQAPVAPGPASLQTAAQILLDSLRLNQSTEQAPVAAASISDQQQSSKPSTEQLSSTTSQWRAIPLSLPSDDDQLPGYQSLLRKHIEFFPSAIEDVTTMVQGRKRRIRLAQVGIRCSHCADIPILIRAKGAVYYPQRLSGCYQAALNTCSLHMMETCHSVPTLLKDQLRAQRDRRDMGSGGKAYWLQGCKTLGLVEWDEAIWFAGNIPDDVVEASHEAKA